MNSGHLPLAGVLDQIWVLGALGRVLEWILVLVLFDIIIVV